MPSLMSRRTVQAGEKRRLRLVQTLTSSQHPRLNPITKRALPASVTRPLTHTRRTSGNCGSDPARSISCMTGTSETQRSRHKHRATRHRPSRLPAPGHTRRHTHGAHTDTHTGVWQSCQCRSAAIGPTGPGAPRGGRGAAPTGPAPSCAMEHPTPSTAPYNRRTNGYT